MSNYPARQHPDWMLERDELDGVEHWREKTLAIVDTAVGKSGQSLTRVGSGMHEIQLRAADPVVSMSTYFPLHLKWMELAVWEANTKKPGTRMVRFGPDVGSVMCLVKVPDGSSWKWYLVCRRKYQLAGSDLFFEFTRGWIGGSTDEDRGRKLIDRDFPGLTTSPLTASVRTEPMGKPVWENNAEFANKITHHLVVVTLNKQISADELQNLLVTEKAKVEYPDANPEEIDGIWLTVCPRVMEDKEAAKLLNAHLSSNSTEEKLAFFGENYSMNSWARFQSLWGWQFPELAPQKGTEL